MRRFTIYHSHGKRIGTTNNLNTTIAAGQEYGCHDFNCPCTKYRIYDNRLKTDDMKVIIAEWVKNDTK